MRQPSRHLLAPRLLAALLTIAATACSSTGTEPTSYPDVAALAAELRASGIECDLAYEGLRDGEREVSTCTIDGEFALLQIWDDAALVDELVAAEPPIAPQAYGANWIVDVESTGTASRLAEVLGGTSRSPQDAGG